MAPTQGVSPGSKIENMVLRREGRRPLPDREKPAITVSGAQKSKVATCIDDAAPMRRRRLLPSYLHRLKFDAFVQQICSFVAKIKWHRRIGQLCRHSKKTSPGSGVQTESDDTLFIAGRDCALFILGRRWILSSSLMIPCNVLQPWLSGSAFNLFPHGHLMKLT